MSNNAELTTFSDCKGFNIQYKKRKDTLNKEGGGDCVEKNSLCIYELGCKFGYDNISIGMYCATIQKGYEGHLDYPVGRKIIHVFAYSRKNSMWIDKSQGSHLMIDFEEMVESRQDIYGENNIEFVLIPLHMFSNQLGRKIDLIELRTIINYIMMAYESDFPIAKNICNMNWKKMLNNIIPKLWSGNERNRNELKQMIKDIKRISKINVYQNYKKYLK